MSPPDDMGMLGDRNSDAQGRKDAASPPNLVERLRTQANADCEQPIPCCDLLEEAADEIERLREEMALIESRGADADTAAYVALQDVEQLRSTIERLRACLKECADGLAEYVEHHYALTKDYPSEKRRYDRDIEPVVEARKLLDYEAPG